MGLVRLWKRYLHHLATYLSIIIFTRTPFSFATWHVAVYLVYLFLRSSSLFLEYYNMGSTCKMTTSAAFHYRLLWRIDSLHTQHLQPSFVTIAMFKLLDRSRLLLVRVITSLTSTWYHLLIMESAYSSIHFHHHGMHWIWSQASAPVYELRLIPCCYRPSGLQITISTRYKERMMVNMDQHGINSALDSIVYIPSDITPPCSIRHIVYATALYQTAMIRCPRKRMTKQYSHISFQPSMLDLRITSDGCSQVHKRHDLPIWPFLHFTVISTTDGSIHGILLRRESYLTMLDGTRQCCYSLLQLWMQKGNNGPDSCNTFDTMTPIDSVESIDTPFIWLLFPLSHTTKSSSLSYLAFQFFYWMNITCSVLLGIGILCFGICKGGIHVIGSLFLTSSLAVEVDRKKNVMPRYNWISPKEPLSSKFFFYDTWFHHMHIIMRIILLSRNCISHWVLRL